MRRGRLTAVAVFFAVCACGSSSTAAHPTPSPSPSVSASPSSSPSPTVCAAAVPSGLPPLMAVLERKASGTQYVARPWQQHDTVAIAGLNAIGRAHATFQARAMPYIGNAATLLSPYEAYTVHGLVYFIDGLGTVWTMGADGRQTAVARFPITVQQQEVSFAVSPDGCHVAATVLTVPPKGPGNPFPTLNGTWKLETMEAATGGTTQVLHTWTSTDYPNQAATFQNIVLVGWDDTGPLVVVGSALGTQGVGTIDNYDFLGGDVAHLGADGVPGAPVASNCAAVQVTPTRDIVCASAAINGTSDVTISVINSAGQLEVPPFTASSPADVAVAGDLVAVTGQWRNGSSTGTLPTNFQPEGWVDANTIFGRIGAIGNPPGNAAFAHLSGLAATIENLGFAGDYVGMLT